MGEIVGAGLLAHVPTIVLPEAERRELNEGKEVMDGVKTFTIRSEKYDLYNQPTGEAIGMPGKPIGGKPEGPASSITVRPPIRRRPSRRSTRRSRARNPPRSISNRKMRRC